MSGNELATFTDRREAIALFDHLRGRDPNKPWPLLPILAFLGLGGSGKSTLIKYLAAQKCCLPDGRAALPYAYLDFTLSTTPKDLLSILMDMRDQLQHHEDGQGRHLTFPRFDLGAIIVLAAFTNEDPSAFGPSEVRRKLATGVQLIESLSSVSSALGLTIPYVLPILAGLKLAGQIPPLKRILRYLEDNTGWKWYRMHGTETGLGANADLQEVLLRLHLLSMPGRPEREDLVNSLLPAAFIADLFDALMSTDPSHAWSNMANVIFFLDGFEGLQRTSSSPATRLLQVLTTEHRKDGTTDPLLLVLGSRDRLPGLADAEQDLPFEQRTAEQDEQAIQKRIRERYERWRQQLVADRRFLRLKDLYLPLFLADFGREDARSYLLKFGEQEQTQAFAENAALVQAIDRVTHGHPLSVALAAAAVLEANARGRKLTPEQFELEDVSEKIVRGHEDEQIRDYLLNLFLSQLSQTERNELIFCAVPRFLDAASLRAVLQLPTDLAAEERWNRYRRLTFTSAVDDRRLVFHPLVRTLLLRRLPPDLAPESDYSQVHRRLREHFHKRTNREIQQGMPDWQAQIEEAYHTLALGDPALAITLGILAQRANLAAWEPLLEAVGQAPTDLMSADTEQKAYEAVILAEQHHNVQDGVTAIVLYRWLLRTFQGVPQEAARVQLLLGIAYWDLPGGDRQANLREAIACYQAALQVYTPEAFPMDWAGTQNNLGLAHSNLPGGDRQANLEQAIACYRAALEVYTPEAFPAYWAMTQNNLGIAYWDLPGGDRQANLREAIACYQAALQVRTREAFPAYWAMTQNNLGLAHSNLPGEDREVNLREAIACYQAALEVYTPEAFPMQWAATQNNLGNAYSDLPGGDREVNLREAMACYQAALQVYTREAFPMQWATTQNNLGIAYSDLPGGDRQTNLKQAIACYQAALEVRTREAFPVDWATTQNNLGIAYSDLPGGDRQANLKQAIVYYQVALQVRTREAFPMDWATTQNNLGEAYRNLPGGDRQTNLKQAIACFQAALQVRTREAFPMQWAATQNNLGNAYSDLPGGDRQTNLERAIACYQAALQVRTREAFPMDWATTQNNLGEVYSNLPGGDRQTNLKQAIAYFQAAFEVFSLMHMDYHAEVVGRNLEETQDELRSLE